ncbi:hypothetical protein B4113_2247 [Geobacillus sp. B4113_201601]|nr:hypothetical protein B4113_2247 [Geobacillus sp. B4113_201601]
MLGIGHGGAFCEWGRTNGPAFLFFFGQKCLFVLAGQALLLL